MHWIQGEGGPKYPERVYIAYISVYFCIHLDFTAFLSVSRSRFHHVSLLRHATSPHGDLDCLFNIISSQDVENNGIGIASKMTPKIDPAILKALSLDAATTTIASHGGSGFASTFKITSKGSDGEEKLFFVKQGKEKESEIMFAGKSAHLLSKNCSASDFHPSSDITY